MNQMHIGVGLLLSALLVAGCSTVDKPATATTVSADAPVAKKTYQWSGSMERKRVALEKATLNSGVEVLRTADNQMQVNVPSDFSFDSDSAEIKAGMRPVLDQFADGLEAKALSHMLIHIVGHTDDVGTDTVNEQLSLARAASVQKYLVSKGIEANRIDVEGRGERQPMISNAKSYGRALNRRVEIFLREPAGHVTAL